MGSDERRQAEELATRTRELSPEGRRAFLDEACEGRAELRRRVEDLLASQGEAFAYFEELADRVAASVPRELDAAREGTQIGAYRLIEQIGRGGMGTVFLAERADGQFDQRAALKVIRRGMESDQALRRFLAERQILASLHHPHIARLLDGGVTAEGLPYFVMEHVAGAPLTDHCDQRRLTIDGRLRLFCTVGEAVQYAHRNLVVHRDLKPSNILVTPEGTVKLLDFGIAKVLAEDEKDQDTGLTHGGRPMTPFYAAPEQFRSEPVTTATDVYSLGVVLYELITGRRPYNLTSRSSGEVERAVLEQEPESPSAALRRIEPQPGEGGTKVRITPEAIAEARATTPARLRRRLAGELGTIVLTALRKEPERRYRSAEQLVDDVRRHLEGRPVMAHKDTLGYRAAKFVRRHRLGVAAAAALAVLSLGFVASVTFQSARIARERDKAQHVANLFVELFKVSDPTEARGGSITARELLDKGVGHIEQGLQDQPEVQASLFDVMGRVYQNLGIYDTAGTLLEKALETRRRVLGPSHLDVGESLNALGELRRQKGDYKGAEVVLREAVALNRSLAGGGDPRLAESLNHLGKVLLAKGEHAEAEAVLREALSINRRSLGADHVQVGESLNNLGAVLYARGDDAGAEPLFREGLEVRRKRMGPDHPLVAASLNNLASLLSRKGDYAEAEGASREALAVYRKLFAGDHPRVATALNNLALILYARADYAAAEPVFRESLAMRRKLLPAEHPDVAQSLSNLGLLLQMQGRFDESEALYREALQIRQRALGLRHVLVAQSLNNLGLLLEARGRLEEAAGLLNEGLTLLRDQLGPEHALVAMSLNNLGSVAEGKGSLEEAEALHRQALAIRRKALRPGHPELAYSLLGLGRVLVGRGSAREAEPLLKEGLEIRTKSLPKESWEIGEAQAALGACLAALERRPEAEALLLAGHETLRVRRGPEHPLTLAARRALASLYEGWGRRSDALRYQTQR